MSINNFLKHLKDLESRLGDMSEDQVFELIKDINLSEEEVSSFCTLEHYVVGSFYSGDSLADFDSGFTLTANNNMLAVAA